MAAPNPAAKEEVRAIRQENQPMDDEDPYKETRKVQNYGNGKSKYINITDFASKQLDIGIGDELVVKTYGDRMVVECPEEVDEDDGGAE